MTTEHATAAGTAATEETVNAPPGYTPEHVALCKRLTTELVASMQEHPGHVVLSVLLTTYMQISSQFGGAAQVRAAEYLVMTGNGFLSAAAGQHEGLDDDVGAIASAIVGFIANRRHAPTLDALLRVYKALAEKHRCCTDQAAIGAMRVSQELLKLGTDSNVAPSTAVH